MTPTGGVIALGPCPVAISGADVEGLGALIAELLGHPFAPTGVLLLAAMRLLADAVAAAGAEFAPDLPGEALIHEAQSIRAPGTLAVGQALVAAGTIQRDATSAIVSLTLSAEDGAVVCALETRLRVGSLDGLVRARAAPIRPRQSAGEEVHSLPLTAAHLARYADLSGDRNPIHLDPAHGLAAGLPGPIVHGMLLVGLAECVLAARWPAQRLVDMRTRFLAPVFAGECVSLGVTERGVTADGARLVRVAIGTEAGQVAAFVDAVMAAA